MANTYEWEIDSIEGNPKLDELTNVVTDVSWTYSGVNTKQTKGNISGKTTIPFSQDSDFLPFNALTKEIVVSWLENILNVSDLQSRVDSQINLIENPPIITLPLPWK